MQQYEASVREGASPGTTVLTLKAADQDIGKNAEVSSWQNWSKSGRDVDKYTPYFVNYTINILPSFVEY